MGSAAPENEANPTSAVPTSCATCADLRGADLSGANLSGADLSGADLSVANLSMPTSAVPTSAMCRPQRSANLSGANLSDANLTVPTSAVPTSAVPTSAMPTSAVPTSREFCARTIFANIDLSEVRGLDSINHKGPSTVGIDTLFLSKGKIPEGFLRGCGVPDVLIVQQRALVGAMEPIQFYSCFISYSTKNQDFAERLHSKMRDMGLRVWFSPEDSRGARSSTSRLTRRSGSMTSSYWCYHPRA